jgi:hypothetical protein
MVDQIKTQPIGKRISPSIIDEIFGGAEMGMMGAADDLQPMTSFPMILTKGGDCRLPLDPKTGANKYHISP